MPKLNFFRKRSNKERQEILARLAASETIGMIDRAVEQSSLSDRNRALQRLAILTGFPVSDAALGQTLDSMLKWMRECDMNINFNAKDFFASPNKDQKYMTKFEKMRTAGAPVTLNASGSAQGSTRDNAEQKIFGYARQGIASKILPSTKGTADAEFRIQAFGDMASTSFQGAIRPKYCTLNVWKVINGSGAQWGKSHFILKDHLKLTSSFVHSDSFDFAGGDLMMAADDTGKMKSVKSTDANASGAVATYHNMTRLIIHASDSMLDSIADCSMGTTLPKQEFAAIKSKYHFGDTNYIEGHIHGEIYFGRDIEAMKISLAEVNSATDGAQVRKNIDTFAARYKIKTSYYD